MNNKGQKKINNEKGITLLALVVTIIVLMILTGITLILVLGQNGIIGKAQQAKDFSINADKATEEGLNNLDNELEAATSGTTIPQMTTSSKIADLIGDKAVATANTAIKDDEGNIVTIPAGFKIASDSATKQEDGIVIEDKDGNQYVWIPVANISNYVRTDYGSSFNYGGNYNAYSEIMPSDEQTSVSMYNGYYIGRYEAGDSISTASKTLRASGASVTNKVSIKKGQAPYNFVTRDQAQTLATGIKTAEGYNATTKLCSSYAWDTALNFIQSKVSNYATSSNQGNYNDTAFSYMDIVGVIQTKATNSSVLIPTGETTPINSIYDMGGNDLEWTTEAYNVPGYPCVYRGGVYNVISSTYPAGYRGYYTTTVSYSDVGFRTTLYM